MVKKYHVEENDPLDPHGDGTIREGDALYDILMGGGGAVRGTRNEDGTWEVESMEARDVYKGRRKRGQRASRGGFGDSLLGLFRRF